MRAERPAAVILIPVYNDWESAAEVLPQLDAQLDPNTWSYQVVIVNDPQERPGGV